MNSPTHCPFCTSEKIRRDDVNAYWCGSVDRGHRWARSLRCKHLELTATDESEIKYWRTRAKEAEESAAKRRDLLRGMTKNYLTLETDLKRALEIAEWAMGYSQDSIYETLGIESVADELDAIHSRVGP